jgi:hypothetical protein
MKIRRVEANMRRKVVEVSVGRRRLVYPFARLQLKPSPDDPIVDIQVDREIASEGFTYVLASRRQGTVHIEQVLEYNKDPGLLRDRLLYALTLEAQKRLEQSALSRRELIRRLRTSPAQFYRLLDQTNYRKSIDQMLVLLQALDCDVRLTVRARSA